MESQKSFKVGKYTYKSEQQFVDTISIVFVTFFVCGYFIAFMKAFMNIYLYYFTLVLSLSMMIHLILKYKSVRGEIKYIFMNY